MGSFTGFSEDDIRKFNNNDTNSKTKYAEILGNTHNSKQTKPEVAKDVTKEIQRQTILNEKLEKCNNLEPISDNARLDSNSQSCATATIAATAPAATTTILTSNVEQLIQSENGQSLHSTPPNKKSNLEIVQARQKLIEEQNRKRKELLSKALADKTKKTLAETQKLKEIQVEFQKLDSLHSGDINILRRQIDLASLDYMEAEKRYFKTEKEYLNAKLEMHLKSERKELLAEHLCTIIERNEEKKAQKLNEMLSQLNLHANLDTDDEEIDASNAQQSTN